MTMFLVFLLGFGVASSLNLGHPEGLHFDVDGEYASSYEDYKPRDYKFEYGVSDPHTGDHKSHWEVRENGVVRGEYSLLEPDGTTRVVQYTADDHGFRAVVKKLGQAVHPPQHQLDLHNTPIIIPEIHSAKLEQPYFKTYDGNAENYVNALDDSNLISLLGDNHQILEHAAPDAHIQEPTILPHSVSFNVAGHHSYPSYEVEGVTQNQETYNHEFLPKLNDNHVPTQQESLHIAEPISYHQPIQEIQSDHQPIYYNYGSSQSQTAIFEANKQPIQYHYPAYIQEPIQEHVNPIHKPNEIQSTIGVKIIHPHGESSSSFIGSTGNPEDDSAYTHHDKGILVPGVQHYQGWNAHDRPIPYQYLQKREVTGTHEK